jgi:hypothetical protein
MNSAIQNLVISLGAMQVARRIPFEDPQILLYVRIGYVISQVVCIGTYLYISAKVYTLLSFLHVELTHVGL